jgi:hypothetical protein
LTYRKLPIERLAAGYEADKTQALGLTVFSPTGSYRLMMLPEAPPADHQWGEAAGERADKGRRYSNKDFFADQVGRALSRGDADPRVAARLRASEQAHAKRDRAARETATETKRPRGQGDTERDSRKAATETKRSRGEADANGGTPEESSRKAGAETARSRG